MARVQVPLDSSELVLHYGRPGVLLQGSEVQECVALSYHVSNLAKTRFVDTLLRDEGQAVMIVDSCDGTPLITRNRIREKAGELEVIRRQKSTGEWLILRKFVLTEDGQRAVVFGMPRRMGSKTAWAHFQATRELIGTGRELGHKGLLLNHTVLDRAIQGPVSRHMAELHSLLQSQQAQNMSPGEAWLLDQMTWTTSAGCSLHDVHNAYKRSMQPYLEDKPFMTALYGSVEALRDSYSSICKGINEWIPRVVQFEDWELTEQEQYQLWLIFGLPHTVVEVLVDLQLHFSEGRLKVAKKWEHVDSSAQFIRTCLVSVFEFREWTDSRWISMGRSSRRMAASLLLGLESLVQTLRHLHMISEYYIKAFTKLTDRHRRAFVVGGVGSHLSDAALAELLEDNRLPLRLPCIDDEIKMELEWVMSLKPVHWRVLSEVCQAPGSSVQSECIMVALISASFTEMRLREARRLPWSLIGGDVAHKLQEVKQQPKPTGIVPGKIWELLQLGIYDHVVQAGIGLLSHAPWAAAAVEEGHVATTMMLRQHSYGDRTLRSRATLSQARPLFRSRRVLDKIEKVRCRLHRLRKKRPGRVRGRHMLIRDLLLLVAKKRAAGIYKNKQISKIIVKNHSRTWRPMPAHLKRVYEEEAQEHKKQKTQKVNDDIQECISQLKVLSAQTETASKLTGPLRMSCCNFSADELKELEAAWKSQSCSSLESVEYDAGQAELVKDCLFGVLFSHGSYCFMCDVGVSGSFLSLGMFV
jgi:hypothetical protein